MSRRPRRPARATPWGTLRPFVLVLAAVVVTPLLIAGALFVLTPSPELRDVNLRFVLVNHSEQPLSNVELRTRSAGATAAWRTMSAGGEIPVDGRWVVERPRGGEDAVGLFFELDGRRYEFHRAGWLGAAEGTLHSLTVTPGPRLKRSPASFPSAPDAVHGD